MRAQKVLTILGSVSLFAIACTFQACGGSESVNKDGGGGDGNVDTDTGVGMDGTTNDTGDMDTGMNDSGGMDSGPNCTNMPCVIGLSVGGHHACALIADGTVRCWGVNVHGQLGQVDGGFTAGNHLIPTPVDGFTSVTQVATNPAYAVTGTTCARTSAGGVLCIGDNQSVTLGQGAMPDNNAHPVPAQVMGLPMSAQATLGRYMGCATTNAGEYWCWGSNDAFGQTTPGILGHGGNPNGLTAPGKATLVDASVAAGSAGNFHNLVLTTTGTVLSWGDNSFDALGRDTNGNDSPNPAPVTGLSNVTQISSGAFMSCAVSSGGVHCWGDNTYGQLGRGIAGGTSLDATVTVALPGNKMASMVSTSGYHTCALATDGTVYCWGRNNAGQVGPNGFDAGITYNNASVTTPQQVQLPAKALAVGTGAAQNLNNAPTPGYSCALLDGGNVYCWGYNAEGELGRSADAGGTGACSQTSNLGNGATCAPVPGPVVWQ